MKSLCPLGQPAVSDYRKAVGEPEGLLELMVFYCERGAGFCSDVGSHKFGYGVGDDMDSLLSEYCRTAG